MGTTAFRQQSTHLIRCDFCHKPTHHVYRISFDGTFYKFCSGLCAQQARTNYNEKVNLGVTPLNFQPIEEEEAVELD